MKKLDEVKTIRSWFTSGILSGRPRNTVVIKDGVQKVISSISYDELGNRIIEKTSDYTLMFERNSIKEIIYADGSRLSLTAFPRAGVAEKTK